MHEIRKKFLQRWVVGYVDSMNDQGLWVNMSKKEKKAALEEMLVFSERIHYGWECITSAGVEYFFHN